MTTSLKLQKFIANNPELTTSLISGLTEVVINDLLELIEHRIPQDNTSQYTDGVITGMNRAVNVIEKYKADLFRVNQESKS